MAEAYHDPLTQLLKRGEDLWRRLDQRQALLARMQEVGRPIDEAYRRFESSPRRDADLAELQRAQSFAAVASRGRKLPRSVSTA